MSGHNGKKRMNETDDPTSVTVWLDPADAEPLILPAPRPVLPSEMPGHHHKIDFPPVENGVDYLVSVVEHLAGDGTPLPRDVKYAVLHLQAAAEVLLKARLQREHWSLVFKDPGRATRERFEQGDFESCTTEAAVDRLRHIAGLRISEEAAKGLKSLAKSRNALQHYGLTAPVRAVEARAATVLDFLLAFVHNHLLPQLTDDEARGIRLGLDKVGEAVRGIQSFLTERRNRLRGELEALQYQTVECPHCGEWAMLLGEEDSPNCLFCHELWPTVSDAIADYARGRDQDPAGTYRCPQCAQPTLILDNVLVAAAPGTPRSLCFGCGGSFEELAECGCCNDLIVPDESGMCDDCLADRFDRF